MTAQRCTLVVFAAFIFNLLAVVSSQAAEATFSWTANEITPSGYKIYYGYESRNYDFVVDVGLPEAIDSTIISKVEGLSDGQTYFFAATAYTASEESDYSTEVEYTTPGSSTPDPLAASDLALQGVEDSVISGTVVTNADSNDTLSFAIDSQPSFGTVSFEGSEGNFNFSPLPNFNGDDSFTFTVSNGTESSSPATANIFVSPVNDKPTAQNTTIVVNEDGLFSGSLAASDIDGDLLSYSLSTPAGSGLVTVNSNGSFSYRPEPNYFGTDSFAFTVSDGTVSSNAATVSVTVISANDPPVAEGLAITVVEDDAYSGQVSGSDADGNALSYALVSSVSHGNLSFNANGVFSYTPDSNYNGTDSFKFNIHDGTVSSNSATVSITINAVNDAPQSENLAITLAEDDSYNGQASGSDTDDNALSFTLISPASHGSVSLSANGSFSYIPEPDYHGIDSFKYSVSDGLLISSPSTVSITVTPLNDAPQVGDLAVSVSEDSSYNGQVAGSDTDGNALSFALVNSVSHGTLSLTQSGAFTYIPDPNYHGSDSFTYRANDGFVSSNPATVSITVTSVNDAPQSEDLTITLTEDDSYNGQVSGSDTDENALSFALVSPASHGSVSLSANGSFSYIPEPDYHGIDSFKYSVSDGLLISSPSTVSITVTPVNDVPQVGDLAISVSEDSSYSGQVTGSDTDGNALSYALVSSVSHGTLSLTQSGAFTYIPDPNYDGSDSFTYRANDGIVSSNPATVSITVTSVNDAPEAMGFSISVSEDSVYTGQISGSDTDGSSLSYTLVSSAAHGSVNLNVNGSFTYTPDANYSGEDNFRYAVSDGALSSEPATVSITVTEVNNAPTAIDLAVSLDENSSYSGQLSGGDVDGDLLEFTVQNSPAHGTLDLNPSGSFTYSPETNYSGEDGFTFTVSDGSLTSNVATVTVAVTAVAHEFASELGELQVTTEWQHVAFETAFVNPAVIVQPTTAASNVEVLVDIKDLTNTGFDIRLNSWDYQNDPDMTETISYLAMERGYHQLEQDVSVIADCTEVSGGNSFQPVIFSSALPTVPVVVPSIVTNNEADSVTLRVTDIGQQGFSVAMQEQESSDQFHAVETVCYIAWEKWTGLLDNVLVEVDVLQNSLTDEQSTVSFQTQFPEIPITLAGMQSANGMDTATLEITHISVNEMGVLVREELSGDSELAHAEEAAGYFALVPFDPQEDSDNDGLSNAEEQANGTHPGFADSDHDGINDGTELQYLLDNLLSADVDSDGDGVVNLLDSDSDNDGVLDGDEIAQGSDPTDPSSLPDSTSSSFKVEVGEIPLTHETVHVGFVSSFTEPVIIANAVTRNGTAPFNIGITNVTSEGFDISIREYDYLDGTHNQEIVSYIVMEKGSHILEDGSIVEAGVVDASGDASEIFFESPFSVQPVVFTSITSANSAQTVAGRTWDVNTSSFMHKLQRQESDKVSHGIETVAYLAWTPGVGTSGGIKYEVGRTPDSVKHKDYEIQLSQDFGSLPFHFSGMQTKDGNDPCLSKIIKAEQGVMTVRIEEEKSRDTEVNHTREIVGFLVVVPQ